MMWRGSVEVGKVLGRDELGHEGLLKGRSEDLKMSLKKL